MKYFKVFGAERTGTMYLKAILDENIENINVFVNAFGSRHEPPLDANGAAAWTARNKRIADKGATRLLLKVSQGWIKLNPIVIIKDPYTWYKSIKRWRIGKGIDMEGEYAMYNHVYKGCAHFIENIDKYGKI